MSLISDSNKEQQQAIIHGEGPQLIVAGAGTGKTRVITARIAWLITEKGLNVDEVLALTFTDKAAEEMEERVDQLLPYGYIDLWISTFHSFCDKILRHHALDIGLTNNYKLINEVEAWILVRNNLERLRLDYYRPLGNPNRFIQALLKHFSRCKDEGITPKEYVAYAERIKKETEAGEVLKELDLPEDLSQSEKEELLKREVLRLNEVAKAFQAYQQLLLENDLMDFGDLHIQTIRLFKERPLVLAKYRKQFKYILVDEFQDTNFVQYELIKLLAAPKNNITVVGDDDQSVYKFRGASISNIMQFKEDYPLAKEVVLIENYRSGQSILDAAYKFIVQNNPNRLEEKLKIDKKLKSNSESAGTVEHIHCQTVEAEAQAVVEKIETIKKEKSAEWSDFAILVRANDSANVFINQLEQAGIPYQFLALKGLYNKPVVVDAVSYLKLLDNYHESSAVFRVLNFSVWGLTSDQVVKLVHYAKKKGVSLYEALEQVLTIPGMEPNSCEQVGKIVSLIKKHTELAKLKPPTELLINFLYDSGYLADLQKTDNLETKTKLDQLQQFLGRIKSLEATTDNLFLADFLEILAWEQEAGDTGKLKFDPEVGPDMVKIMTVHSAKGLEFDYVFLASLVDRKFPTDERQEQIEIPQALISEKVPEGNFHLEEERRLFYVAMTRARKGLFLTSAEDYGGARKKKLSRFLLEMGYKLEEQKSVAVQPLINQDFKNENMMKVSVSGEYVYELPKHFSFSQMATYEKCPLQYKFANVLKIPTFGSHYFSFGTTIHNTLQKFLEQSFNITNTFQADLFGSIREKSVQLLPLENLYLLYEESWVDEWYLNGGQKEEYRTKGKALLKNFHESFIRDKPEVKFLEVGFKNMRIGGYKFLGRIDRVDQLPGGQVEIIDYKTGSVKNTLAADDKRQLLFYQIAAEESLGLKVGKLTYHYLEEDKKLDFLGDDKKKGALKDQFLENIKSIQAQKFEPTPSEFVCTNCQFKGICEYKKL